MWQKIWQTWKKWQEKQKRVAHITFSEEGVAKLERLANNMDADPKMVLSCALVMLEWIVHHAQNGGEITAQNGNEEFSLVFSYENKYGQVVTIPSQDFDNVKPLKTLGLSNDDKRFLRNLGIDLR